jgi:hypothetical protein
MASEILGRTPCPIQCGHDAAHVKLKTDKATQAYPYIHCRGCGSQLHTKNAEQAAHLLKITRAEKLDAAPPAAPTPTPRQSDTPPTPMPRQENEAPTAPPTRAAVRRFGFGRAA